MERYDVIVIGGGHAGVEATALAARSGARTLLVTQNLETIGQMSCNPAIGGIAKGTVVREVDALGGVMGRATDRARIQFRMLNRSKGPAVWSPRAQCDRGLYRRAVRHELELVRNVTVVQGTVSRLLVRGARVEGLDTTDGRSYRAKAVVVTGGTFLRGRIHIGTETVIPGGRAGESSVVELSQELVTHGLTVERFKTGTPPRIDGRTVDLSVMTRQDGDPDGYWFSYHTRHRHPTQVSCYLTHTTDAVRELIEAHLGESAMYGGAISGRGPRYCPSIEDKVIRFPSARRHQVFLEPEGLDTHEMYVNGLSTSLPAAVQLRFLACVPGLERVHMTRPGYAIEYDYFPPTQLDRTLRVKHLEGLYLAGQVNGTTGYEEAAGQGVVAGINAAAFAAGRDSVIFDRSASYLGVMIDDLVTRGVDEPYRLFTSRSEFRLLIRQDNAMRRLYPIAMGLGLWTDAERVVAESRLAEEDETLRLATSTTISAEAANPILNEAAESGITQPVRVADLAKRPAVDLVAVMAAAGISRDRESAQWAAIEIRYAGYMERERQMAERLGEMEEFKLSHEFDYQSFHAVSTEAREKLNRTKPSTLGQAARIPGVTPNDLQGIILEIERRRPIR